MSAQVLQGVVKAIRPFGTFIEVSGEDLLVHGCDQSWYWPYSPSRHLVVGARKPVWVGPLARYGAVTRVASFRLAYPSGDPAGRIKSGDRLFGTISKIDSEAVNVTFGPAQDVDFSADQAFASGIILPSTNVGSPVAVLVEDVLPGPTYCLALLPWKSMDDSDNEGSGL